jgi:hypothetical protein
MWGYSEKFDLPSEYFSAEANGYKVVRLGLACPLEKNPNPQPIMARVSAQFTETVYVPGRMVYPLKGNGPLTVFADYESAKRYYDEITSQNSIYVKPDRYELWTCNYEPVEPSEQSTFLGQGFNRIKLILTTSNTGNEMYSIKLKGVWYRAAVLVSCDTGVNDPALFQAPEIYFSDKELLYPRTVLAESVMLLERILYTE